MGYLDLVTTPFALPKLAYAYDALEPWCQAETLELHHDKHHRAYVDAANDALEALASVDPKDKHLLAALQSSLTFNAGGHVLHSLFWTSVGPDPTSPNEALQRQITQDCGDIERLKALLITTCTGVQGTGWGALSLDSNHNLLVSSIEDHHNGHAPGASLLAVVDVWEHAYYLGYRNDRPGWCAAAVEHLDWAQISSRYDACVST